MIIGSPYTCFHTHQDIGRYGAFGHLKPPLFDVSWCVMCPGKANCWWVVGQANESKNFVVVTVFDRDSLISAKPAMLHLNSCPHWYPQPPLTIPPPPLFILSSLPCPVDVLLTSIADGWMGSAIMTSLQRCRVGGFLPGENPSIMYAVQFRL